MCRHSKYSNYSGKPSTWWDLPNMKLEEVIIYQERPEFKEMFRDLVKVNIYWFAKKRFCCFGGTLFCS